MNQESIGKFIASLRKERGLTQEQLASSLGVSDKTISNWENARCMPDLSMFKPLSEVLGVTVGELISGKRREDEEYHEKIEQSIPGLFHYADGLFMRKDKTIGILILVFGAMISFFAMSGFVSESSWGSIYSFIGCLIATAGVFMLNKKKEKSKRILLSMGFLFAYVLVLLVADFVSVLIVYQAPRFSYIKETGDNVITYRAPFYSVYRINYGTKREYYIIDLEGKYDNEDLPIVPFDRDLSGIRNIIKYKNPYVGNNSNTGKLLNSLPLGEFGYTFSIAREKCGVEVNYHMTGWYIEEDGYLKQSLLYDAVSMFLLIDNLKYVTFNFSGESYEITKEAITKYPHFEDMRDLDVDKFDEYLEKKIMDLEFVTERVDELFIKRTNP